MITFDYIIVVSTEGLNFIDSEYYYQYYTGNNS